MELIREHQSSVQIHDFMTQSYIWPMIPFCERWLLFITRLATIRYFLEAPHSAMATQTMTKMPSQSVQNSQLLHLVGSKAIVFQPPKRSSSFGPYYSANREYPISVNDSFDAPAESPRQKQLPTSTNKIGRWIECRYYQYEVTWGPYVLTPGEKIIINSLVLIMFSLIPYYIINVAIFQQGVVIIQA